MLLITILLFTLICAGSFDQRVVAEKPSSPYQPICSDDEVVLKLLDSTQNVVESNSILDLKSKTLSDLRQELYKKKIFTSYNRFLKISTEYGELESRYVNKEDEKNENACDFVLCINTVCYLKFGSYISTFERTRINKLPKGMSINTKSGEWVSSPHIVAELADSYNITTINNPTPELSVDRKITNYFTEYQRNRKGITVSSSDSRKSDSKTWRHKRQFQNDSNKVLRSKYSIEEYPQPNANQRQPAQSSYSKKQDGSQRGVQTDPLQGSKYPQIEEPRQTKTNQRQPAESSDTWFGGRRDSASFQNQNPNNQDESQRGVQTDPLQGSQYPQIEEPRQTNPNHRQPDQSSYSKNQVESQRGVQTDPLQRSKYPQIEEPRQANPNHRQSDQSSYSKSQDESQRGVQTDPLQGSKYPQIEEPRQTNTNQRQPAESSYTWFGGRRDSASFQNQNSNNQDDSQRGVQTDSVHTFQVQDRTNPSQSSKQLTDSSSLANQSPRTACKTYITVRLLSKAEVVELDIKKLIPSRSFVNAIYDVIESIKPELEKAKQLMSVLNNFGWYLPTKYTLGHSLMDEKTVDCRDQAQTEAEKMESKLIEKSSDIKKGPTEIVSYEELVPILLVMRYDYNQALNEVVKILRSVHYMEEVQSIQPNVDLNQYISYIAAKIVPRL